MRIKNLRWGVVALVALATVINCVDRQSLNVLWPEISEELYPDKSSDERKSIYAFISMIFVFAYAFWQAIFGRNWASVARALAGPRQVTTQRAPLAGASRT